MAQGLIEGNFASNIIFLAADTYPRYIHPTEKSVRTIFGDAGTATLLSADSRNRLHSFVLRTDGSGAEQLIIRTGGARHPRIAGLNEHSVDESSNVLDSNFLYMNEAEIFNFTIQSVPTLVNDILAKARLGIDDIDCFVFHQANAFILEHLRRKMRIPRERFAVHLENCGNTVSATIPIALEVEIGAGNIKAGMKILLVGFGVGLSWGGCVLEWNS